MSDGTIKLRHQVKQGFFKFKPFSRKQKTVLTWWCPSSLVKDSEGIIAYGSIRSGKTVCMSLSYAVWAMESFDGYNTYVSGYMTLKIATFDYTNKTVTLSSAPITDLIAGDIVDIARVASGVIRNVLIANYDATTKTVTFTDFEPNSACHGLITSKGIATSGGHAEGKDTISSSSFSHAEGLGSLASGSNSHAEGTSTIASGIGSHTEGGNTTASSIYSHAEGLGSLASGSNSHAEGRYTTASGVLSHAEGFHTNASGITSHVMGRYNKALTGEAASFSTTADAFVIGNGTATDALSNAFRVTFDGSVYGLSAYNTTGADYSEYFEWFDGNPDAEDRVGLFVTLTGEKIKLANDGDYIVGVTSGNPSIVGDHPSESWSERYARDVYGRLVYEDINIPEETETDEEGNTINVIPEHTETRLKANPEYDPTKEAEYQNREKRPEWSTVGMLGKLVVRDDGTCVVNGYCSPSNGIAMATASGYRVIARLDETHIKVLIK
nr:peptidase G2 autoproteolytic cleavage domain-containing protein [Faecalispora anaeroviscerum]